MPVSILVSEPHTNLSAVVVGTVPVSHTHQKTADAPDNVNATNQ